MKKEILTAALILATVSLYTNASANETNVGDVSGQTYENYNTTGNGGAIINTAASSITDSTFRNNTSTAAGGAIHNTGTLTVQGVFENNSAIHGGAIYNGGELVVLDNTIFQGNFANVEGAAIANYAEKLIIKDNVTFKNNSSFLNGYSYAGASEMGALYTEGNAGRTNIVEIGNNVTFEGNKSYGGAGMYVFGANEVTVGDHATFKNNSSQASETDLTPTSGGSGINIVSNGTNGTPSVTVGDYAKFEGNSAKYGAAVDVNSSNGIFKVGKFSEFTGNKAVGSVGGAIYNAGASTIGENAKFERNTALAGGALYNDNAMQLSDNASFIGNSSDKEGGAIYNNGQALAVNKAEFKDNVAGTWGGAIFTQKDLQVTNSSFENNNAAQRGGALMVNAGNVQVSNSVFKNNTAGDYGGAAGARQTGSLNIANSSFEGNKSGTQGGAVIQHMSTSGELNITNSTFKNNETKAEGGAIWAGAVTNISNSSFEGNKTTGTTISAIPDYNVDDEGGAAVFVGSSSKTKITNSTFANNQSGTVGGAIATRSNAANDGTSALEIISSNFSGNTAEANGGAVNSYIDTTITDTSFTNNKAGGKGGAVWANQNLTINAQGQNVTLSGNSASEGGDIYMNTTGSNLNLNAAPNKIIKISSGISGIDYNMVVNQNAADTGSVVLDSAIKNAAVSVQHGALQLARNNALQNSTLKMESGTTLNTINNSISTFGSNITLADNTNIAVDVDFGSGKADNFANVNKEGLVTLTEINKTGLTDATGVSLNLADAIGIESSKLKIADSLVSEKQNVLTPIRYLTGGITSDGIMSYGPTGYAYKDFNPAIMASPTAAQIGGFLTQLNSYDEAFHNLDMHMLMSRSERQALKAANRYAAAYDNYLPDPIDTQYTGNSVWFRPYTTLENVHLKNGPKVANDAYGVFFGDDSKIHEYRNGWDAVYGVYGAYNGSRQSYDGVTVYQNGGTFGLSAAAIKNNFFTGVTANIGANAGAAHTIYGTDDFNLLMSGAAIKSGYNFEFLEGHLIFQPSFQFSYSFVDNFNYTNAAGVKIKSDPLNVLQFEPGIKLIGKLSYGWQPYLGASVIWNAMDKTKFTANDVSLPELSVKPYVKYGVGVNKVLGERCTGFFQTYVTNGGRNGVGMQGGFKWILGKAKKRISKA